MAGTALYIRKKIGEEASYTESIVNKELKVIKKYIRLFEVKEAYIKRLFRLSKKGKTVTKTKHSCLNLIYLQHSILKEEEHAIENVDIELKKVIDYDTALKDPDLHFAVSDIYTKYSKQRRNLFKEMQALSKILTEQYNRLATPEKYKDAYSDFSKLFKEEQNILQQEFKMWEEEKQEFKQVEKKAKPVDMNAQIEAILKSSTLVLWGNSDDFNTGRYYSFSNGMQLRMVIQPGFKKMRMDEDTWKEWGSFAKAFMMYRKPGQKWKTGKWTSGWNFFVYPIQYHSDHVGRPAIASLGVGYPEQFEPQMQQIANNDAHRKLLIQLLKKFFRL